MQRFLPWIGLTLSVHSWTCVFARDGTHVGDPTATSSASPTGLRELNGEWHSINLLDDLPTQSSADEDRATDTDAHVTSQNQLVEKNIRFPLSIPKDSQTLALNALVKKWSANEKGRYIIPFDEESIPSEQKKTVFWCFRYLQLGSNLLFRRKARKHTRWIQFKNDEPHCNADLPWAETGPVFISFGARGCYTRGTIVRGIMRALGFGSEHLRHDRDLHLEVDPNAPKDWNLELRYPAMENVTVYDMASIMHDGFRVSNENPLDVMMPRDRKELFKYNKAAKMFLTKCDWAGLNKAYPGRRLPPKCTPEDPPKVLVPQVEYPDSIVSWVCHYSPDEGWEQKLCKFANGAKFPDLDFIPKLPKKRVRRSSLRHTTTEKRA